MVWCTCLLLHLLFKTIVCGYLQMETIELLYDAVLIHFRLPYCLFSFQQPIETSHNYLVETYVVLCMHQ